MKILTPNRSSTPSAGSARTIGGPEPLKRADNPNSFGVAAINPGLQGRAIAQFGGDITRTALTIDATLNRIATNEAEEARVGFDRELSNMFFNPESGYFNTTGRTAFDGSKGVNEDIGKLREQYSDGLNNDRAKNLFNRATDPQVLRAQGDVMRHASRQFDAWEAATVRATIDNTLENASLYWNDPKNLAIQLELGRQSVIDSVSSQGLDAETVAQSLKQYNSQFANNTIQAALGENAAAGQTALAQNAEMLQGTDLVRLQNQVDKQFNIEKLKVTSEAAVVAGKGLVDEYGEQTDARKAINDQVDLIGDKDLRELTRREANTQLNMLRAEKSEERGATFEEAQKVISEGGTVQQYAASNPEGWEALSTAQKATLRKGPVTVSDAGLMSDLMLLPLKEQANLNPRDYLDRLSSSDISKLTTAVSNAREGNPVAQVGRTRAGQVKSMTDRLFGTASVRSKNSDVAERYDEYYSMITSEEAWRKEQKGSELSSQEFTDMLNDMTRTAVVNKSLFGFKYDSELGLESVPTEELMPLSRELNRRGRPATSVNLIRAYQDLLQQGE